MDNPDDYESINFSNKDDPLQTESEEVEEFNFNSILKTRILAVKNMFIASELKSSETSKHYIVKDSMEEFYYLKVISYRDFDEFSYCLKYYTDLMTFTQQLAQTKKDVLKILNVRSLTIGSKVPGGQLLRNRCDHRLWRIRLYRYCPDRRIAHYQIPKEPFDFAERCKEDL